MKSIDWVIKQIEKDHGKNFRCSVSLINGQVETGFIEYYSEGPILKLNNHVAGIKYEMYINIESIVHITIITETP